MNQVAQTIIDQMGGAGRLSAMVSAYRFVDLNDGVQFQFKGSRKANYMVVKLDPSDTYVVEFWKTGKNLKCVKGVVNIYAEDLKQLFESTTGLYLSL